MTVTGTVHIVDHSAVSRLIVALALKRAGFSVRCHSDSLAALQEIARAEKPPALVLIEISMPRLNGYQMTVLLRKQPRLTGVPIVLMSAHHSVREWLFARLAGANTLIVKPFVVEQLVALARRLTEAAAGPPPTRPGAPSSPPAAPLPQPPIVPGGPGLAGPRPFVDHQATQPTRGRFP
jgi:DNA-binding response OmpR family regulator